MFSKQSSDIYHKKAGNLTMSKSNPTISERKPQIPPSKSRYTQDKGRCQEFKGKKRTGYSNLDHIEPPIDDTLNNP